MSVRDALHRFQKDLLNSFLQVVLLTGSLAFVAEPVVAAEAASLRRNSCFSAAQDPVISRILAPQATFHETPATIAEMHQLIFDHRDVIDPRLIYHRIVGESMGQPEAVNKKDGGYGLFQFTGRPWHSRYTYRQILQQLYRRNPGVSHRLIQLKYYLDVYLPTAVSVVDAGYGCNRAKTFNAYTNLEKVSYLGWGSCSTHAMWKERQLCSTLASYHYACQFSQATILGSNREPLCYLATGSQQTSNEPPGSASARYLR